MKYISSLYLFIKSYQYRNWETGLELINPHITHNYHFSVTILPRYSVHPYTALDEKIRQFLGRLERFNWKAERTGLSNPRLSPLKSKSPPGLSSSIFIGSDSLFPALNSWVDRNFLPGPTSFTEWVKDFHLYVWISRGIFHFYEPLNYRLIPGIRR